MLNETIKEMGKRLFRQSIKPYTEKESLEDVLIVGLDSEYYEAERGNELVTWQLGWTGDDGEIFTSKLTLEALLKKVPEEISTVFFATFFVTAEAQFFLDTDWKVSEYKGRYSFEAEYGGKKFFVLDVATWFPYQPLKEAAKVFNLEKLEFPIVEKMKAYKETLEVIGKAAADKWLLGDKEFVKYAINDACVVGEILRRVREFCLKTYNIDVLHSRTPAATSSDIFRKFYVTKEIDNKNWSLRNQALRSAWGGRTECFFRGVKEKVFAYDAHAHHPSSAIALEVLPRERDWLRTTNLRDYLTSVSGLCCVSFKFPPTCLYPCLPVVSEKSLIFPLEGESNCSGSEVKLAVQLGAEVLVERGWVFSHGTDIITRYFKELDEQRKQAETEAESEMYKLFMNSIVGKLFQKNMGTNLQQARDYAQRVGIPIEAAMQILKDDKSFVSVGSLFYPEWYALILGKARATISKLAWQEQALMISSDSVILDHSLEEAFVFDRIPYKFEREGGYVAYRCKFYRVEEKIAHHAVHNRDFAREVLENFLDKEEVSYTVRHIVKLREAYQRSLIYGQTIVNNPVVSLDFDYKRQLFPDGTTKPWKNKQEREEFLADRKKTSKGQLKLI